MNNNEIVKLLFSMHFKYNGYSNNWGATKGEDHYQDVFVILTGTAHKLLLKGQLNQLAPMSQNKLYAACTRAKGNLYISSSEFAKKYKI